MTTLGAEEIARRRPVWEAMSDLFLDTEVRFYVPRIARICAATSWSLEQLDRIFWCEVFPLAIGNMLEIAGEWGMLELDETELIQRANEASMPTAKRTLHGWMVDSEWRAAGALIERLRTEPAERWPPLEQAWDVLGRRYFEDPGTDLLFPVDDKLVTLRAGGLAIEDEWRRYEPIARGMLLAGDRHGADARASAVITLLRSAC